MNDWPVVSVCIPTYNHAKVLKEALRSATSQSYRNLEILVLDNASADDTEQVVIEAAQQDSRIRYVRHAQNIGMAANFSACITLATGKFIKLLCADDALDTNCVAEMVAILGKIPSVTLVGCARRLADEQMNTLRIAKFRDRQLPMEGREMIRECFFLGNRIGAPTAVMFRREDALKGFDERYSQLIDLEMWFYFLKKGQFFYLTEPLCTIRLHAEQTSETNLRIGRTVEDRRQLFRDFSMELRATTRLGKKYLWDVRMAYSLARTREYSTEIEARSVTEVFFPHSFRAITYPAVAALTRLGLAFVWRSA